jgi:glutamine amidotransferase
VRAGEEVAVVRTGTANLASVLAGLGRAGARARVTEDAAVLRRAARVVVPGVGAFGAAMATLNRAGLTEALRQRIAGGEPTLAVCVGLQILFAASEESPGVEGLGVFPGTLRRFPDTVRVPQLGWNRVVAGPGCRLIESGYAYFANSFRLADAPPGTAVATADHGGRFVAGFERGGLLALQCHPELSGAWGLALLRRWLARVTVRC